MDQADAEQGVAAQGEEVVVDADLGHVEDLGEQGAQHLLARVAGPPSARRRGGPVGDGEGRAVGFAVDGQRQGVEDDDRGGHEVFGERRAGRGEQFGLGDGAAGAGTA